MRKTLRKFTLIEMMVAVGILLVMLLLLSPMLLGFSRIWQTAQSNIRIYENAQMIFNMLGQDFKTALAGNQAGRELSVWWKEIGQDNLVSRVTVDDYRNRKAVYDEAHMNCLNPERFGDPPLQVGFWYDRENYQVKMARSDAGSDAWNSSLTWRNEDNRYYTFVEGVTDFYFRVSPHNSTELPDVVVVTFSLVDAQLLQQRSIENAKVISTMRTFSRSFYLGRDRRLGAPAQVSLPEGELETKK